MDFKSAFWQIELHPDSRYLTVFHANDKLYRYKRLTMGVKPAQGELNMALQPLFANIPHTHLIHDDLIVATKTDAEHLTAITSVMETIANAGITNAHLGPPRSNSAECVLVRQECDPIQRK